MSNAQPGNGKWSAARAWRAALIVAGCSLAGVPAHAQSLFDQTVTRFGDAVQDIMDLRPSDVTNIHLGIGPGLSPTFEGSRNYSVRPVPLVSLHYRDILKVDNNQIDFTAFDQVLDLGDDIGSAKINFGPSVNLDFGRSSHQDPALRGMGGISLGVELGGYVNYTSDRVKVEFNAGQDVANGHGGAIGNLFTAVTLIRSNKFALGETTTLAIASSKYLKSYFGVTPLQSLNSGLPVFHPSGGLKNVSEAVNASYTLSRHWSIFAAAAYERLLGDAAASPLITMKGSADQAILSVFAVYAF